MLESSFASVRRPDYDKRICAWTVRGSFFGPCLIAMAPAGKAQRDRLGFYRRIGLSEKNVNNFAIHSLIYHGLLLFVSSVMFSCSEQGFPSRRISDLCGSLGMILRLPWHSAQRSAFLSQDGIGNFISLVGHVTHDDTVPKKLYHTPETGALFLGCWDEV